MLLPLRLRVLALTCCLSWLFCLESAAFVPYIEFGQPLRWNLDNSQAPPNNFNRSTKAIRYYMGASGWSSSNRTNELNAVRAAFGQWQSIPGSRVRFEEAGLLEAPRFDPFDGTNVIFWTRSMVLPNGVNISGYSGYTEVRISADDKNEIMEADVVLNGLWFDWFTDFSRTNNLAQFVEAVAAHEIGHLLGLDHTPIAGATVYRGGPGISAEAGLSADEVAAARWLYPDGTAPSSGTIRGNVRMGGIPVFGAVITAENSAGNIVNATVSESDGSYFLPMIPPGEYRVRVTPLDPKTSADNFSLQRGSEIALYYDDAHTEFLPTTNRTAAVLAGRTTQMDWTVTSGAPLRITSALRPFFGTGSEGPTRHTATVPLGSSVVLGVLSADFVPGAKLHVTGNGLTVGPTEFEPAAFTDGRNALRVRVAVSTNATPGLRSFVVEQNGEVAYANGFVEILPPFPDYNFDNLDDRFQRKHWNPFTLPAAAPAADPDNDRYNNLAEFVAGSNPLDPLSFFYRITQLARGRFVGVTFDSVAGKKYQLWVKRGALDASWERVGSSVQASGSQTTISDPPLQGEQFYRVEALPE